MQVTEDRFLRLKQIIGSKEENIAPIIPVAKSTWWQKVKSGEFPAPTKLGPRTTVWRASEIYALLER